VAGDKHCALPWSQHIWLLVLFLGMGLTFWWIQAVHGETRMYLKTAQNLRLIFALSGRVYVRGLLHALSYLGLVLWPPA
jgi:uncharacterized membrane protein YhfC